MAPDGAEQTAVSPYRPRMDVADVKRGAVVVHLISFCGGPERPDGIENFVQSWGARMTVLDVLRDKEHDMADEGRWAQHREKLTEGVYDAGWYAPPCCSFCANRGRGPGPRALRGALPPDLYGLPHLKLQEKETVRIGTCLAARCAESATLFHSQNKPFGFEQPKRRPGKPSMYNLDELLAVAKRVNFRTSVQCMLGAKRLKPTNIMNFLLDFVNFFQAL